MGDRLSERPAQFTNATSTAGQRTGPIPMPGKRALRIAREEPLAGLSPDEGAAVWHVLDSLGDTCPECD
jgi:hypothetical protein